MSNHIWNAMTGIRVLNSSYCVRDKRYVTI